MHKKREERRKKMEENKKNKADKELMNEAAGKMGDVDFENMIDQCRQKLPLPLKHGIFDGLKLIVCVRKRPISKKELTNEEIDCVTVSNPKIYVHDCKVRVDGITKYLDNQEFQFDNSFSEEESSKDLYGHSIQPLLPMLFKRGVVTCFAYGQTGSGKTFTMKEVESYAISDIFNQSLKAPMKYYVSFFEIYGGRVLDLLNNRNILQLLEDQNQKVQIQGLIEKNVTTPEEMHKVIEFGHKIRTTHSTTSNDTSSRSHAICQIVMRDPSNKTLIGKLILVDLAGSERAQDCQSNNRQRRLEGAEINKSLLALKECIRAMDTRSGHIPFRAAKLTMVLRDSFIARQNKCKIIMISCISPGHSSSSHTINTLRYADRLKDKASNNYENPQLIENKPKDKLKGNIPHKGLENNPKEVIQFEDNLLQIREENDDEYKEIGGDIINDPESNKRKEQDWAYLKKTLHTKEGKVIDPNVLTLHEKAGEIFEMEEEMRKVHLNYMNQESILFGEENKLLQKLENIEEPDVDGYVNEMEKIVTKKLELYNHLYEKLKLFKKQLSEEEEIHAKVTGGFNLSE